MPLLTKHTSRLLDTSEKSNDILLIQCPPWDTGMPPLGIAYLSSYLRKYGYDTLVFDLNIALYNLAKEETKYLWEQKSYDWWIDEALFRETWAKIREITTGCINEMLNKVSTKVIGLSLNFAGIKFANELIRMIKELHSELKIILGGWGCIDAYMRSLYPKGLIDVFVVGEGEETLLETVQSLKGLRDKKGILGAIFRNNYHSNYKPRPPIMNLDSIPWPTFSEFNLEQYKYRILPLFTSRGCISNCSFCNDWPFSKPYRFRSAKNIFEEIKYHIENNRIEYFSFKDLLCNGNINGLNSLCDLIINSGIKIGWDSQAISHKEMSYELLCKLKKAGCETLIYGIESFSNNVLKRMRKLFTQETAERVLRDTYKAGIRTYVNIIVGFPGETEEDFKETYDALERNWKYINQISAISVCLANGGCDLDINSQNYGLILPSDSKIRAKKWTSVDGENNYEMRKKRAEKILKLINELGLSYETITI